MRHNDRLLASLLMISLLVGTVRTAASGATSEGDARPRTIDVEPANNDPSTATAIFSDEVVSGSLLSTTANDSRDWYKITVPYDKVLNMSMCMENYSYSQPWLYNFDLVGFYNSGGTLYPIQSADMGWLMLNTEHRLEAGYFLNLMVSAGLDVWILVGVNGTLSIPPVISSQPSNYSLSVTLSDPIAYTPGQNVTRPIDKVNGPNAGYFYKLIPSAIPEGKVFDARLRCPANGDFDLYIRAFLTQFPDEFWLHNGSWANATNNQERCRVGGANGTYYMEVRGFSGAGTYSLTSDVANSTTDNNNSAAQALPVQDTDPHSDYIEQGMDPFDWWRVNMRSGNTIDDAYFSLTAPIYPSNLYCMYVYDSSIKLMIKKYNTENGSLPVSTNPPNGITNQIDMRSINATSDGPIYFLIRAITHYYRMGDVGFIPARGAYKMTFKLPNDAPLFNGSIPDIHMLEDSVYDTNLSNYFTDPDGDMLTYTLLSTGSHNTNPSLDNDTGRLTLRPLANWSGTETMRFRATDDGPGKKWAEGNVTVVVYPVNDGPVAMGTPPDVQILEDGTDSSIQLSRYCFDVDGDKLSYSAFPQDPGYYITDPKIDSFTSCVTFRPGVNWSGTENVRFRAMDDGPGNLFVELNVTVHVTPVNDPPAINGSLSSITVLEENVARTPDVSPLFTDSDDEVGDLTYSIRVISAYTHPPGSTLNISYNAGTHAFDLGPTLGCFGAFLLELSCIDNHPGTAPIKLRFNLTVDHRNHDPALKPGILDPKILELKEGEANSSLVISDFFTDRDLAKNYANDTLKFSISAPTRLEVNLSGDGRITVDTGRVEYVPGIAYEEKLVLTATDMAGKSASLNLTVRVLPVDDAPLITKILPDIGQVTLSEGRIGIFCINAADNDTADLIYTWILDDVLQKENGSAFSYQPGHTIASIHTLKVSVSDGTTTVGSVWKITVNRLPSVTIISPSNSTKFKKDAMITFVASGTDPDGDTLSFTWRDETGKVLGIAGNLTINSLPPGTHVITVEVSDGNGSAHQQVTVVITSPATNKPSGGVIPGFELTAIAAAAGLHMAALRRHRRNQTI
jgi:hypothetical protein